MARTLSATIVLAAAISALCCPSTALAHDLYWADYMTDAIHATSFDGFTTHTLVTEQDSPGRIALDADGGKMYWTGWGYLRRANLDGTAVETVINGYGSPMSGLALDPVGGKVYWSDLTDVFRANLDGTDREQFPLVGGVYQDLAIDLVHGHVYMSDYNGDLSGPGRVRRTNLDGSGEVTVVDGITDGPIGLGVDPMNGKLFWAHSDWEYAPGLGGIQCANLDGTDVEDIIIGQHVDPLTLDLAGGKLYWAGSSPDMTTSGIWRAGFDGSDIEMLPLSHTDSVTGLALIPEPASLALLAVGIFGALGRRRTIRSR